MSKIALLVAAAAVAATAANAERFAPLSPPTRVGGSPFRPRVWEEDQEQRWGRPPGGTPPFVPSRPAVWEEDQEQRWGRPPGGTPPFVPSRPAIWEEDQERWGRPPGLLGTPRFVPPRPAIWEEDQEQHQGRQATFEEKESSPSGSSRQLRKLQFRLRDNKPRLSCERF